MNWDDKIIAHLYLMFFIYLKVCNFIEWGWFIVLSPVWVCAVVYLAYISAREIMDMVKKV